MREIKFRAYIKEEGIFIYFDIKSAREGLSLKELENNPIMQYTGLKDKNGNGRWGKEIYEGDIIKDKDGEIYIVKYQPEWGAFVADQGDDRMLFFLSKDNTWGDKEKLFTNEVKVIGNIYENPEILK